LSLSGESCRSFSSVFFSQEISQRYFLLWLINQTKSTNGMIYEKSANSTIF